MSRPQITVVGLGPAGRKFLTLETAALLAGDAPVWLRTSRHPAAVELEVAGSFDYLYETLGSFEAVYERIVDELIDLCDQNGQVIYAVPGSPVIAERTVELLQQAEVVRDGRVQLDIRPALGFTELCWVALAIDPMAEAVTIIDAINLDVHGAGRLGPLLITQVHSAEVLSDVIDVLHDVAPSTATVLQGLGTPEARVVEVAWNELRSEVTPDHLTSIWVPRFEVPMAASLIALEETLRLELQCSSTAVDFSTEALRTGLSNAGKFVTSAVEALVSQDPNAGFELEDGLADLLYLLMIHVRLSAQAGLFSFADLAETAVERRGYLEL